MKEMARMLIGSQNYRLDGPNSDYDYKVIMMPEFEDFYTYHKVDKNDLPDKYDSEHYNVMSILTFDSNLRKGNINALELLFSRYSYVTDSKFYSYLQTARKAYADGYIFTVWDTFVSTVEGMMKNSLDRYGVNRKSASRALYLINLCYDVADHDFVIDEQTWGKDCVFTDARELRFNEYKTLPTKEEIFSIFESMKTAVNDLCNYHRLMYSSSELETVASWNETLEKQMKDVVKASLRREL